MFQEHQLLNIICESDKKIFKLNWKSYDMHQISCRIFTIFRGAISPDPANFFFAKPKIPAVQQGGGADCTMLTNVEVDRL